jgi:AcrR family transcriptional regulator
MPRGDRESTRARILDAAERLIASDGFGALGVNAVAAAAGIDTVLISRYFDGLPGVLGALARERRLWPEAEEVAREEGSLADAIRSAMIEHGRELRDRPLTRAALAWELAGGSPLTTELAKAREAEYERLLAGLRERFRFPPYADVPALAAVLSAAVTYLALHSADGGSWHGMELGTEAGWRRIEKTIGTIVRAILEETAV